MGPNKKRVNVNQHKRKE